MFTGRLVKDLIGGERGQYNNKTKKCDGDQNQLFTFIDKLIYA